MQKKLEHLASTYNFDKDIVVLSVTSQKSKLNLKIHNLASASDQKVINTQKIFQLNYCHKLESVVMFMMWS